MSQLTSTPPLRDNPIDYAVNDPEFKFLVYARDLVVSFDGFRALDLDRFGILHNELRVVIGPNGAGKTTLCDVISGKTRPSSGEVFFDCADVTRLSEPAIAERGVGRKFQTPTVFDSLTVYENLELALPGRRGLLGAMFKRTGPEDRRRIKHLMRRVRLGNHQDQAARYLSHGQRQWLEIGMLILSRPKLLLVDEPAAGLSDEETRLTAELLLELRHEHAIIVIEHDMSFVRQLASRVTVLNEGRILAEGPLEQVQEDPAVIKAYLGR